MITIGCWTKRNFFKIINLKTLQFDQNLVFSRQSWWSRVQWCQFPQWRLRLQQSQNFPKTQFEKMDFIGTALDNSSTKMSSADYIKLKSFTEVIVFKSTVHLIALFRFSWFSWCKLCWLTYYNSGLPMLFLGVSGVPWNPQILANYLTLSQPATKVGKLCPANNIGTPGFSDLPTALYVRYIVLSTSWEGL